MMITPTAKKWFGAVLAAVTLTMVTSVAPASAAVKVSDGSSASSDTSSKTVTTQRRDSGWNIP